MNEKTRNGIRCIMKGLLMMRLKRGAGGCLTVFGTSLRGSKYTKSISYE